MSSNHITKVAIVGATGNVGSYITSALLATGKHTITALSRSTSTSVPQGVLLKAIDYDDPCTIIEALRGQDALVITLGGLASGETDQKLFEAAAEAGVKWILPNEWAPDTANERLIEDVFVFKSKPGNRDAIAKLGRSKYIAISTGFWYEYSLAIAPTFGFDFKKREVTFFDDGNAKISVSTWPHVGRTVAALLSLPMRTPHGGASLESLANKVVYTSSFHISQKDMFASVQRVTKTTSADWQIKHEAARQRYVDGIKEMQAGDRVGMAKMMYARIFWDDGLGDTEGKEGNVDGMFGFERESLDEATEVAVERAKLPGWADQ